jgi:hypothetical protein
MRSRVVLHGTFQKSTTQRPYIGLVLAVSEGRPLGIPGAAALRPREAKDHTST